MSCLASASFLALSRQELKLTNKANDESTRSFDPWRRSDSIEIAFGRARREMSYSDLQSHQNDLRGRFPTRTIRCSQSEQRIVYTDRWNKHVHNANTAK